MGDIAMTTGPAINRQPVRKRKETTMNTDRKMDAMALAYTRMAR